MKTTVLISAVIATAALVGCAAEPMGPPQPGERAVAITPFTALKASAGMDVTFTPGAPSATLTGDQRYFDRVSVSVNGDTLVIGRNAQGLGENWRGQVKVVVTGPADLKKIEASSGANVTATRLTAAAIAVSAASGANAKVEGACQSLTAKASSGANVLAQGLKCATAAADASSGANAYVYAEASAQAEASSGANVRVQGPGVLSESRQSSGGSVTKVD